MVCVQVPLKDDMLDCYAVGHVILFCVQTAQAFNYSTWSSMADRQGLIIIGLISP